MREQEGTHPAIALAVIRLLEPHARDFIPFDKYGLEPSEKVIDSLTMTMEPVGSIQCTASKREKSMGKL